MKILILGADGYLGLPTLREFEDHEVLAVDSCLKRAILDEEQIHVINEQPLDGSIVLADTTDWDEISTIFKDFQPDAIINYAELPSAPYSMESREKGLETVYNNISGNLNIIYAIKEFCPQAHLIKLGTLGEYGTPNIDIEEGWLEVNHNGRTDRLLYPKSPFSIYHLSKVYDSDALAFACRAWGLRVTDLNQGFVWGHETDKARPRFTYDGVFGTALNRFIAQAVSAHPITVYGKGDQTRGILNIRDTMKCVRLALENPAKEGEFRVFNQFTESWSINSLAILVDAVAKRMGFRTDIQHIPNPRKEKESHYYNVKNDSLMKLGLHPHLLNPVDIQEMIEYVSNYPIDTNQIMPKVKW